MTPPKPNYQREMEALLHAHPRGDAHVLLHACCAPCSSAVLERLVPEAEVTPGSSPTSPSAGSAAAGASGCGSRRRRVSRMTCTVTTSPRP